MSYSYRDILKIKFPDRKVQRFTDSTYEGIIWNSLDMQPKPTKAELDAAIANEDNIVLTSSSNFVNAVTIPALSSTSIIPLDNSTPLITEGTKLLEIEIFPVSQASKLVVNGTLLVSCNNSKKNIILALFKDSVCIGSIYKYINLSNNSEIISFTFIDSTLGDCYGTINPKYSIRMGADKNCIWGINQENETLLNNTLLNNGIVFMTC